MNYWNHKLIALNDAWGPGADHSLTTPLKVLPEFTLRPRYLKDAQGKSQQAYFSIEFSSGYLADGWQHVNLIPMGIQALTPLTGLVAWDPSQRDAYRRAIVAAANAFADPRTARLEAVIPYVSAQGAIGYNKVRLFYIANAVIGGPDPDLVVVKIATHVTPVGTVQGRQDGDGHGPPR